jgi:hypothetical protein
MKTKEQIITELQKLEKDLRADIKEIELLADKKGVYVRVDYSQAFGERVRKTYPELELTYHSSIFRGNGFDSVSNTILNAIRYPESNFLSLIGFQELNKKQKTFKMSKDKKYYLHHLSYFGFPEKIQEEIKTVKEFQNGYCVLSFTNDDHFAKFVKLAEYINPDTQAILDNITAETKKEYQEEIKKNGKAFNEFYPIHKLAELAGVPSMGINYRLIQERLLS